jgi:hypothetical protein
MSDMSVFQLANVRPPWYHYRHRKGNKAFSYPKGMFIMVTLNMTAVYDAIADTLSTQSKAQGGTNVDSVDTSDAFNGSSLSGITEAYTASVLKADNIGSEQTNYDVRLNANSRNHWATNIEVRNMTENGINLGPSTTLGKNRFFELDKFLDKVTDTDSYIVYDLESDPENIDIYEIPADLVLELWSKNQLGKEVTIDNVKMGYKDAVFSRSRFLALFPIEYFGFTVSKRHKAQGMTADEVLDRASNVARFRIQTTKTKGVFDFSSIGL